MFTSNQFSVIHIVLGIAGLTGFGLFGVVSLMMAKTHTPPGYTLRAQLSHEDRLDRIVERVTRWRPGRARIDYGRKIAVPWCCAECGKEGVEMVALRDLVHANYVQRTKCDTPF